MRRGPSRASARARLAAAVVIAALSPGCAASTTAPPRPRASVPDKAAMYEDAALVPTREGELARRELAFAASARAAVESVSPWRVAFVEARLGRGRSGRLLMTIAPPEGVTVEAIPPALASQLRALIVPLAPEPWTDAQTTLELAHPVMTSAQREPPTPRSPSLLLALCLVGLGASAGVTLDRLARARAREASPGRGRPLS
ncbi:MAG: hypothetical protein R3A51_14860 [Nannocystaceae bacterium]